MLFRCWKADIVNKGLGLEIGELFKGYLAYIFRNVFFLIVATVPGYLWEVVLLPVNCFRLVSINLVDGYVVPVVEG